MATSTLPRDNPLQLYKFTDMTASTTTALLNCLNNNTSIIPGGPSVLQLGNTGPGGVGTRCLVIAVKANNSAGRGFTVATTDAINNLNLKLDSTGWSIVT